MRHILSMGLITLVALVGCAHKVRTAESSSGGDGGSGGSGGGGGSGGTGGPDIPKPVEPAVTNVRAPDQTSVRVQFNKDVAAILPSDPAAFFIASAEVEPLTVKAAIYDPLTQSLTLSTALQKLGATYDLTINTPLGKLDGQGGAFLAADTAVFWTVDFGSFDEYEIVADRVAVGQNAVAYLEQGMFAEDGQDAVDHFDNEIFPVESKYLGPPSDVDNNGRVVLLGLNGFGYYGGYFNAIDTLPSAVALKEYGYHSNETDMVYINVEFGTFEAGHVLPHEYSHLLYQAKHGFEDSGWSWHNEGLAECAVHIVNGYNDTAPQAVYEDPTGAIATGLSLVDWQFGNYTQYGLAYMFWTYLAAQMQGGVEGYIALFNASGSPAAIGALIQEKLGKTFAEAHRDFLLAMWAQAPSGPYGFGSMLSLFGAPPTVPAGIKSLGLAPYTGVFFKPGAAFVNYPGTQGPNIVYAGVSSPKLVDLEAPFAVSGGALVVLNANQDFESFPPEPSGPDLSPPAPPSPQPLAKGAPKVRDRSWLHPPPFDPRHLDRLAAWRERTAQP